MNPLIRSLPCLLLVALIIGASVRAEDNQDLPLGPVGGVGRLSSGVNYIRVTSVTAGAPGALAGLQVNDFIHGAFGEEFTATGGSGITGAELDFGQAIERAEAGNGQLPLKVLRPGVGELALALNLTAAGTFGPAYPLNSPKFDAIYQQSCQRIHEKVQAGSVDTYLHSWGGLALLGHTNWNSTSGAKPYRNSINKIRDAAVTTLTNAIYAPVEDKFYDGTANPNYAGSGLETWGLGSAAMFLSEYRVKTGDTNVDPVIQRTAELLANRVQWWKQPDLGTGYSPTGTQIAGMVSHGGVTGDYIHLGWGGGINIVGVHLFSGLALAKRAGADMTSRPRDGHYFGFTDPPSNAVPAGMEYYNHTLDEKFNLCWEWMAGRCAYYSAGNFYDGHVCYTLQGSSSYDAAGRTAGTLFGMLAYANGTALSSTNQNRVNSLKGYLARNYARLQECHAYTHGGQVFYQLCMPYLDDRGQRYFLENWRSYYNLSRSPNGSVAWVPGRSMTDVYLDLEFCGQTYGALPGTIATGGLPHVPGYTTNRILANFKSPWLSWPNLAARYVKLATNVQPFSVDICDGLGNALSNGYTATWSNLSGQGTVTFSSTTTNSPTVTFTKPGSYRIQLTAVRGTSSITEPIDVDVPMTAPAGFVMSQFPYEVFTGISGGNLANLTNAAKFIANQPDITGTLTSLQTTYSGNDYGQRLRGFIVPPTSGTYKFFIASDDSSQFRFSATGTNPASATVACSVGDSLWTDPLQWNKYASQASANYSLTAGQPYYFEVLHKEGGGSDHCAVGWTVPGVTGTNIISGTFLAMRPAPVITKQPVSVATGLGSNATFSVTVNGGGPLLYSWRLNGVSYWTPGGDNTLGIANVGGGMAGIYDCIVTTPYGVVTSAVATLTITNTGAVIAGGLWREVYAGIGSGGTMADLTNQSIFPRFSTSSGVITNSEGPSNYDDAYGQRWTGWLKPQTNGNYRFYVASDDACELWLSTAEYAGHKTRITSQSGYAGVRAWNSPSAYFALEAGKRYYVEYLHKDGGGGDNSAFTWHKQGDPNPTTGAPPIDGAFLEYRLGGIYSDTYASPPLAVNDTMNGLVAGLTWAKDLVANDLDADNASLRIVSVSTPLHGAAVTNSARFVAYSPQAGYQGVDSFSYVVQNSLSLLATGTVSVTVSDPYSGLVGWWRLDETSGTSAVDSIGAHNGTFTGSPIFGQPGVSVATSNSVWFNGSNTIATISGFTTPSPLTICAWVKPGVLSGERTILAQNGSVMFKLSGSALRFTTPGIKDHTTGTLALSTNAWNFVAVTFTPSDAAGAKFYLNGNLAGTVSSSTLSVTANTWYIGRSQSGEYFDGGLDDVRLSNRVLSPAEINALYTAMISGPTCSLGSPSNGAVLTTNNVDLVAWVFSNINNINKVEFLSGASVIGTVSNAPYNFTWTNVAAGSYTLKARTWFSPANYTVDSAAAAILVNGAPAFTNSLLNLPAAVAGAAYSASLAGAATDPNAGQTLTYSRLGGPTWLLVATNGALSGTPLSANQGTNNFTVRVTDPYGLTGDATLRIVVNVPTPIAQSLGWQGANLVLAWSGGIPPYQVQTKTNLTDALWVDVGVPTTNQSIVITPGAAQQYYRIRGQ